MTGHQKLAFVWGLLVPDMTGFNITKLSIGSEVVTWHSPTIPCEAPMPIDVFQEMLSEMLRDRKEELDKAPTWSKAETLADAIAKLVPEADVYHGIVNRAEKIFSAVTTEKTGYPFLAIIEERPGVLMAFVMDQDEGDDDVGVIVTNLPAAEVLRWARGKGGMIINTPPPPAINREDA